MSLTPDELRMFQEMAQAFRVPLDQLDWVLRRYRELALAERRQDLLARLERGDTEPALLARALQVLAEQHEELAAELDEDCE